MAMASAGTRESIIHCHGKYAWGEGDGFDNVAGYKNFYVSFT